MTQTLLLISALLVAAPPKRTPEVLEKGKASFNTYCASCHGATGAGDGAAAASLAAKPRNFHKDKFKQGSKLPQVFETIGKGVPNTPMAPFAYLSEDERWALSYWVLELKAGKK